MKSNTEKILATMSVLAWITFIGLMIKAGAILISYGVSIANPEAAKNLYRGMNWYELRQLDFWHYTGVVAINVTILALEVQIAFLVIKVLSKIKMSNPFTPQVSKYLERISYFILLTWVTVMLHNGHLAWLGKRTGLPENYISGEFILLAGIVFVFAQIFKKGVELQSETELTV